MYTQNVTYFILKDADILQILKYFIYISLNE